MFPKRIIWQLYPSYLLITILSLLAVTWYATSALRTLYMDALAQDLETRARVIERRLLQNDRTLTIASCDPICQSMRDILKCRITIILPDGQVIGESDKNPEDMENHRNRPEIMQALQGVVGREIRHSDTVNQYMMYIAVPVRNPRTGERAVIR
ncbi:MAG: PAS domain-containing sensor histidine kinase, partial [Candidatus Hinthialibacter sp.]